MADDVLVRYKALTDQYLKDVNKVIKANDQVGTSAEQGNKEAQESFKKTGKGLDTLGKSVRKLGTQLIAAFAIKQIVTSAVKTIVQFEDAMAAVSAITGVTGKELDKFRDRIISISKTSGVSAKEVAKAFQLIGSATPELLESAESLGLVTEQAIILSKAARLDLTVASDALTKSLNQFGLEASDAADVVNILATSQQKGTATIDQLNESLKNAGAVANAAGLTFEETNVALQALAKGGQVGAEAGTGLRSVLLRLAKTTDSEINPTINSFSDVIQTLSDRNVTLQQATKLVGDEGARYLLTLLEQNDVVQRLNGNLNEQGNALEQAKINTDTVSFAAQQLASDWENFILGIESGEGTISSVLKGAIELASTLVQKLQDLGKTSDQITFGILDEDSRRQIKEDTKLAIDALKELDDESLKIEAEKLQRQLANAETEAAIQRKQLQTAEESDKARAKSNLLTTELFIDSINQQLKATDRKVKGIEQAETQLTDKQRKAAEKLAKDTIKLEEEVTQQTLDFNEEQEESESDLTIFLDEELRKREQDIADSGDRVLALIDEQQQEEDQKAFENREKRREEQIKFNEDLLVAEQELNDARIGLGIALVNGLQGIAKEGSNLQKGLFIFEKALTIGEIIVNLQREISSIAASNAILGAAGIPLTVAQSAAAKVRAAIGIATVVGTAVPQLQGLAEGTEFVKLGGNKKGTDTVPAMLNEGEAVIKARHNDPITSKAYNEGRLDHHYFATQTLPALQEQKKRFQENRDVTFADNIANSIGLNFFDKNIVSAMQNNTQGARKNTDRLEKALKPQHKTYRG